MPDIGQISGSGGFGKDDSCFRPPGVTVCTQQAGLQLGESQTPLGLQPDHVLDQLAPVAQVDPEALQVLFHQLLELHPLLLGRSLQARTHLFTTSDS